MQMNGRTTVQKHWTDEAGRKRRTLIMWDHEGMRQEIERLDAAIERRNTEARLHSSSKEER